MHRNDRILTVCIDCHDEHGFGAFEHHLTSNPSDSNSLLCQSCHAVDLLPHMTANAFFTMAGPSTQCRQCHMPQTARGGSGRYGLLAGFPTGQPSDNDITYFENDLASHLWKMPFKNQWGWPG